MHDLYYARLFLFLICYMQASLASVVSDQTLLPSLNWTADGAFPTGGFSFNSCQTISIDVSKLDESWSATNNFFMLSQDVSGRTDYRELNPGSNHFIYQMIPDEGQVMLTLLDWLGGTGRSVLANVTGDGGDNCDVPSSKTDIALELTNSTGQTLRYCDIVEFQISGGNKPYGIIVTMSNSENSSTSNVTLGPEDDAFSLPNNNMMTEETSVVVSVFDQNGSWSNSSELLSFGPPPPGSPACALVAFSYASNSLQSNSTSVPSGPTSPSNSGPNNPPGSRHSKKVSPVVVAVPIIVGAAVIMASAALMRRRVKRRKEDRRYPAIIPDIWSQPNTEQRETPRAENDLRSDQRTRKYFDRITRGRDRRNSTTNSDQERMQSGEREGVSGPREIYHVDGGSVLEYPPPYQDRTVPIPTQNVMVGEMRMNGSILLGEEGQEELAGAGRPLPQPQSRLAAFDQEPEAKDNVHNTPIRSQSMRKGE